MVPPSSVKITRVPTYLICQASTTKAFRVRGYHPVSPDFPDCSTNTQAITQASPLSLAATKGISVDFFSYGYLDVSVPRVRFLYLCIQYRIPHLHPGGFPHSDISGSKSVCRLPEAFRRLQRPSSPPTAKASTVCASSLDHITKVIRPKTKLVCLSATKLLNSAPDMRLSFLTTFNYSLYTARTP